MLYFARLDPFFHEVTIQLLSNGALLAHISLYFLGHDYLRRQVEKVGTFLQEWIREASNSDGQLLDILLLY